MRGSRKQRPELSTTMLSADLWCLITGTVIVIQAFHGKCRMLLYTAQTLTESRNATHSYLPGTPSPFLQKTFKPFPILKEEGRYPPELDASHSHAPG